MLYILINDVNLKVRCGKTTAEKINTNIGVPQGECLSLFLFTLYLAAALEIKRTREDRSQLQQIKFMQYGSKPYIYIHM